MQGQLLQLFCCGGRNRLLFTTTTTYSQYIHELPRLFSKLVEVLVIELDDRSHWQMEARKRDAFKDAALASAGVPILRVRASGR